MIISKASYNKEYNVYVSVDVETTNSIKQDDSDKEQNPLNYIISVLGEPIESRTFYAPSDEQERLKWNEAKQQYDDQFGKVISIIPDLMRELNVAKGYGLTEAVLPGAIFQERVPKYPRYFPLILGDEFSPCPFRYFTKALDIIPVQVYMLK